MNGEPIVVEATGIRAVFESCDDRWAHSIELISKTNTPGTVMRSVEGGGDEDWPPSPAIQQLNFQFEPDGTPVAMGVGMSGRNHWSLSCRAVLESDFGTRSLHFHVACRARDEYQRIGSCYRIVPEAAFTDDETGLLYRSAKGNWRVTSSADYLHDSNRILRMDQFGRDEIVLPRTVEWSYYMEPMCRY